MKKHRLAVDAQLIIDIPPTRAGGREGIRRILASRNAPQAAVCYNDVVAFGALSELGERGMRAGRDFAVIGFDGVAATEHSNPPLTTMDVEPARLGAPNVGGMGPAWASMEALTRSLSAELAPQGIRAVCLRSGRRRRPCARVHRLDGRP
jgi:hypothetical protein